MTKTVRKVSYLMILSNAAHPVSGTKAECNTAYDGGRYCRRIIPGD